VKKGATFHSLLLLTGMGVGHLRDASPLHVRGGRLPGGHLPLLQRAVRQRRLRLRRPGRLRRRLGRAGVPGEVQVPPGVLRRHPGEPRPPGQVLRLLGLQVDAGGPQGHQHHPAGERARVVKKLPSPRSTRSLYTWRRRNLRNFPEISSSSRLVEGRKWHPAEGGEGQCERHVVGGPRGKDVLQESPAFNVVN